MYINEKTDKLIDDILKALDIVPKDIIEHGTTNVIFKFGPRESVVVFSKVHNSNSKTITNAYGAGHPFYFFSTKKIAENTVGSNSQLPTEIEYNISSKTHFLHFSYKQYKMVEELVDLYDEPICIRIHLYEY